MSSPGAEDPAAKKRKRPAGGGGSASDRRRVQGAKHEEVQAVEVQGSQAVLKPKKSPFSKDIGHMKPPRDPFAKRVKQKKKPLATK